MTLAGLRLEPPDGLQRPKVVSRVHHDLSLEVKLPHELEAEEEFRRTKRVASLVSKEAVRNDSDWLARKAPPDPSAVAAYLMLFGYSALDAQCWTKANTAPLSQLRICVIEHAEIGDHTWYTIDCSLTMDGSDDAMYWQAARRLCHMRELWYANIKREFGTKYNHYFGGAHFAHHGAIVGTTARLNAWCKALAACINSGNSSPHIVALTLRFLDAPHLLAMDQRLRAADVGIDPAMVAALQGSVESSARAEICAPISEIHLAPSPTQIGVSNSVDPLDIDIDMEDDNVHQCADEEMCLPSRSSLAVVDIDCGKPEVISPRCDGQDHGLPAAGEETKEDMSLPICEEGGMSIPSRNCASPVQPTFLVTDMVDFLTETSPYGGLPVIEEEKTILTETTVQDR